MPVTHSWIDNQVVLVTEDFSEEQWKVVENNWGYDAGDQSWWVPNSGWAWNPLSYAHIVPIEFRTQLLLLGLGIS